MKRLSRSIKSWDRSNFIKGLAVSNVRSKRFLRDVDLAAYSKKEKMAIFDAIKCAFFQVFLEQKEFSFHGLGKIRLAWSWGRNRRGGKELCTVIMFSDTSTGGAKTVDDGIFRCFQEEKLKQAMENLIC